MTSLVTSVATMSRRKQITWGIVLVYVAGLIGFGIAFGIHSHQNNSFNIVSPYQLTTWLHLVGPLNLNKGVLYLLVTAVLTVGVLWWVARRMEMRPNRVQTAVEWGYDLTMRLTNDSMDRRMARKWFPLVFTLFVFVLVTNLLGYIPLPVNTADKIHLAGVGLPSFQIYAADTNVALPLVLAFGVFVAYNVEGLRAHGFSGYLKSLVPGGGIGGGGGAPGLGRRRGHAALPVPAGDHLALPQAAVADDPAMGQPARGAPPDRLHGG